MQKLLVNKAGWKLVALLCVGLFTIPAGILLLRPSLYNIGLSVVCLFWLASMVSYAFGWRLLPMSVWKAVALPCTVITIFTGSSFLGYRATRLAIIDLDAAGVIRTLAEMTFGTAFALVTLVPVLRLAGFLKEVGPGRLEESVAD